jgi:hypothetical protein
MPIGNLSYIMQLPASWIPHPSCPVNSNATPSEQNELPPAEELKWNLKEMSPRT